MKWYLTIPEGQYGNVLGKFIGYTDNEYIMREYQRFLYNDKRLEIKPLFDVYVYMYECEDEDAFIMKMYELDYQDVSVTSMNKLYTVHSFANIGESVVINRELETEFLTGFNPVFGKEFIKMVSNAVCWGVMIQKVVPYLVEDIRELYKDTLFEMSKIIMDTRGDKDCRMWDNLDECYLLKEFLSIYLVRTEFLETLWDNTYS